VKILVDVNIFIDVMTKRANWEGSLRILNLVVDLQRSKAGLRHWLSRSFTSFGCEWPMKGQPAQISILTPEEWLADGTVAKIEADLQM